MLTKHLRTSVTALFLFSFYASAAYAEATKWRYLVKTYPLMGNDAMLSQAMNKLGAEGWELVSCTGDAKITCIFKRPEKK